MKVLAHSHDLAKGKDERLGDSPSNPFIITTSAGKPEGAARQTIRRHVMRGKNRRKHVTPMRAGFWINAVSSASDNDVEDIGTSTHFDSSLPVPRHSIFSDMQCIQYPVPMQPYMFDYLFRCKSAAVFLPTSPRHLVFDQRPFSDQGAVFDILKKSLYPIELCCQLDPMNVFWFIYVAADAAYLHSCLWTTQAYSDFVGRRPFSRTTLYHESKTLELLQKRLNVPSDATSDISIAVVVVLGLHRMVMLRGGLRQLGQLRQNTQLQIKVCRLPRVDLSTALVAGTKPLFFAEGVSNEPYLTVPGEPQPFGSQITDPRLAAVAMDLCQFSTSANLAFQTDNKIEAALYQEVLISIEYRLMMIDFDKSGYNEALHLGMLAFATTIFLRTAELKVRFAALSTQLRELFMKFEWTRKVSDTTPTTKLWLLFITAITACTGEDDEWLMPLLKKAVEGANCSSWSDALAILKKVLWIDPLHNQDGKRIFDRVGEHV